MCKRQFVDKKIIIMEINNKITTEIVKVFKCPQTNCEFNSVSSANLIFHFLNHTDKKIEFKYYNSEEIKKCHIIENKFICSICTEIFNSKSSLKVHFITVHNYKEKPTDASPTDESCSQSEHDISRSSSIQSPPDNCCKVSTSEDATAKIKKSKKTNKQSDESQRWYTKKTCGICKQTFKNSKTLSKHIKAVHNKIKSFICNVCGYKSARKATLIIHQRQHSGAKPLSCKYCPFRASDPSAMIKHEKLHTNTTEDRYKCKHCDFLTIQTTGLKNHILFKHPEKYSEIKCDLCDFVSVNPLRLTNHKNHHKIGLIRKDADESDDKARNINNTTEVSSDCFLPIESTDSIVHNPQDTGGVTIIHGNNNGSIPPHSEDTQF